MAVDLTDFQIEVVEENIVNAIVSFLTENYNSVIDEINDLLDPSGTNQLKRISHFENDYVDPSYEEYFPSCCVWIDETEDQVKSRAVDLNVSTVRILIADQGPGSLVRMYRYQAALLWLTQHDRTFDGAVGRLRVQKRVYYTPISTGDEEVRVSETFLQTLEEVERR